MEIRSITDDQFEEMAKRHPTLFEKSKTDSFQIGQGWLLIVDTLCYLLSSRLEGAKNRLKYVKELNNAPKTKNLYDTQISEIETAIEQYQKDIPTIIHVKEKFGGLIFKCIVETEEARNYIDFAQTLSMRTCECCGAPGEPRNEGWTKVLCEKHHRDRNNDDQNEN